MNPFLLKFVAECAEYLTTALIHFVWQGAVLVVILLITVKLLNVVTARIRYLLSVGTMLMMGMAPFATAMLHQRDNSQLHHSLVEVSGPSIPMIEEHVASNPTGPAISATTWNPGIKVYVLMAWLAGVFLLSTRLAIGFSVTLWIRGNLKPLSDDFEQRVRILGDRLRVDTRKRVFACVRVGQAVAVGFIRPIVLIPASWLTQFSPQTIEAIIAHELAHIRRWDIWVNLVQRIIETLLFYHPAVWWLSSRIRLEREMCCDEIAAECFDRALYARSLESIAKTAQGNMLMATLINGGKKMKLLNRIRYLFGGSHSDAAGNWWAAGLATVIIPIAAAVVFSMSTVVTPSIATADNPKTIEKILTASVQRTAVTLTERYVCQIHAHRHINVRALTKGLLETIPIKDGQHVKKGDLMFAVRPNVYQLSLDAENADAKLAQLNYDYTKKLYDDKVVSHNEVAQLEAKLDKAKAKARLAAAELDFATIKAPFDGFVGRIRQQQDSLVLEGDVLTSLTDNSVAWVYFNVSELRYLELMTDVNQRKEDLRIELLLANGKKFEQVGKIGAIEADFDNGNASIPFRADFPNPDGLLRHGQAGTVLLSRVLNDAIVIPQRATFEVLSKRYVYVVDKEDVAHLREVFIQNELEDAFVVNSGLGVEDRIVVDGIRQVHDGEKVDLAQKK